MQGLSLAAINEFQGPASSAFPNHPVQLVELVSADPAVVDCRTDQHARGAGLVQVEDVLDPRYAPPDADPDIRMSRVNLDHQALGPEPSAGPDPRQIEDEQVMHALLDRPVREL